MIFLYIGSKYYIVIMMKTIKKVFRKPISLMAFSCIVSVGT
jgi:hypothetical protein